MTDEQGQNALAFHILCYNHSAQITIKVLCAGSLAWFGDADCSDYSDCSDTR
jgi:hypothetical protein